MRKFDEDDAKHLNAEDWQLDLLNLNPSYVWWGNNEDYMSKKDGWDGCLEIETWKDFDWELDEYNECVNFYFNVYRKNHECPKCKGQNLNPKTKQLYDDWYDFNNTGRKWSNKITEIEVDALMKAGRLSDFFRGYYDEETQTWVNNMGEPIEKPTYPTPEEVNNWNRKGLGHDGINMWICVGARAKHLGIYGKCDHCVDGYIYDEPNAKVGLQLWILHPRKGCSRGVYINHITKEDLPNVFNFLKNAQERNNERFSKIP